MGRVGAVVLILLNWQCQVWQSRPARTPRLVIVRRMAEKRGRGPPCWHQGWSDCLLGFWRCFVFFFFVMKERSGSTSYTPSILLRKEKQYFLPRKKNIFCTNHTLLSSWSWASTVGMFEKAACVIHPVGTVSSQSWQLGLQFRISWNIVKIKSVGI